MRANAGTSRIRIAVFIVAAISSAFSALATLALHIGQANVRIAAAAKIAAVFTANFAKRLSLISSPEENQYQQINPKHLQKTPLESRRLTRDPAANGRPRAAFAEHDVSQRDQTADQMRPVQSGKNIGVPAVKIFIDVEAARDQALPQDNLRGQETQSERHRNRNPDPEFVFEPSPQRAARNLDRHTADQDETRADP